MANKKLKNKIGESFEQRLLDEFVPDSIWNNISNTLDNSNLSIEESTEKIKTSFESKHQDLLPDNLWKNVENQLEIEGVWQQVLKGLNKRARIRYWQEKGVQVGILALAILLLRDCDLGKVQ